MRIGIYGGSFNPPHIGHFRAAQFALDALHLDRLLLIPAGIAPHKPLPPGSPDATRRLAIMEQAVAELADPRLTVSDMEVRREGKSYTYQTVQLLREQYPEDELFLLMGTDMLLSFDQWKNPDLIAAEATLGVFYRGDREEIRLLQEKKNELGAKGYRVELLNNPVTVISSTDLRRMIVFGCAQEYLLPGTLSIACTDRLYGAGEDHRNLSLEALEKTVLGLLKPARIPHVLGCRDTAVKLGARFGADTALCARAGLLHDITKALDEPLQLALCRAYGVSDVGDHNASTVHALTGALVAEKIFGECPEVVNAIAYHTTGRANMTKLEKIVYVADFIEPTRRFPGVEKARQIAFQDLDQGVITELTMTLDHLKAQGKTPSPLSAAALRTLL